LPNEASLALHRSLGFTEVGILDDVGHKDGRYISTTLMELRLATEPRDQNTHPA
jgi:phosphinothricin acetyltransferase